MPRNPPNHWSVVVRVPVLVLAALIGFGASACGGGGTHRGAAAKPSDGPAGAPSSGPAAGPLPANSPSTDSDIGTCKNISYRLTGAGVEVDASVATTPAKLNIEADDADDNPVT